MAARARALATLRAASASRVAHMLEFAIQQAEEAGIDTAEARALLEELQSSSSTADVDLDAPVLVAEERLEQIRRERAAEEEERRNAAADTQKVATFV